MRALFEMAAEWVESVSNSSKRYDDVKFDLLPIFKSNFLSTYNFFMYFLRAQVYDRDSDTRQFSLLPLLLIFTNK